MVLLASEYDQSRFLKAADLQREKKFRITAATEEEVGEKQEKKLVVWFTNDKRGLVLNKTNNRTIRGAFGDAVDGWKNKITVIFPTMTDLRGKLTPALRVQIPPPKPAATAAPTAAAPTAAPSQQVGTAAPAATTPPPQQTTTPAPVVTTPPSNPAPSGNGAAAATPQTAAAAAADPELEDDLRCCGRARETAAPIYRCRRVHRDSDRDRWRQRQNRQQSTRRKCRQRARPALWFLPQESQQQQSQDLELCEDPELLDDDDLDDIENLKPASELPPMYAHGDPDPRPLKNWLVKGLIPACGHGLLSGQWGTYKSFIALELATTLMTAQPFLGGMIKRQCGVLFLAAEGADEMRLRINAAVREKCGAMPRAPFRWYETAPVLLHKGAVEKLVAMARQAEASLIAEFGLPLGLIIIDTIVVSAGYPQPGAESDPAVTQTVMNVLKEVARQLNCFVLGVDHYGKDVAAGTRGSSAKEASADLVLACLGDREQSGSVTNTRLAVRKCRGGPQGQEFYFAVRRVEDPVLDEDGDPITTLVIDWVVTPAAAATPQDPWAKPKRQDQRTAALRLKRVLMAILAEQGVELAIPPDGPIVRMVDQKFVRKAFYACTPTDEGTPERKGHFRRQKFLRALDWAEDEQLIAVTEINGVTYLRLIRPREEESQN